MIVGIRILYCFLAIALLSSCGTIAVPIGPEGITKAERDKLNQLIGQSREMVVRNLGSPVRQFILDDRQIMLYVSSVAKYKVDIPWVIIPWPIPHNKEMSGPALRCLVIEIDSNNLVKEHKFKHTTYHYKDQSTRCLNQFFSERELEMATFVRTDKKQWELKEGASWPNYGPPGSGQ